MLQCLFRSYVDEVLQHPESGVSDQPRHQLLGTQQVGKLGSGRIRSNPSPESLAELLDDSIDLGWEHGGPPLSQREIAMFPPSSPPPNTNGYSSHPVKKCSTWETSDPLAAWLVPTLRARLAVDDGQNPLALALFGVADQAGSPWLDALGGEDLEGRPARLQDLRVLIGPYAAFLVAQGEVQAALDLVERYQASVLSAAFRRVRGVEMGVVDVDTVRAWLAAQSKPTEILVFHDTGDALLRFRALSGSQASMLVATSPVSLPVSRIRQLGLGGTGLVFVNACQSGYEGRRPTGDSLPETFQQARLKVRKKYPHPFYWASHVQVGAG